MFPQSITGGHPRPGRASVLVKFHRSGAVQAEEGSWPFSLSDDWEEPTKLGLVRTAERNEVKLATFCACDKTIIARRYNSGAV